MPVRSVTLGNRIIDLHALSGIIMEEKKWTTLEVSGGGGSGYVHQGGGYLSNNPIKSTTTVHDQLLVRADDGQEHSIQLNDMNVVVRKGHRDPFVWGRVQ